MPESLPAPKTRFGGGINDDQPVRPGDIVMFSGHPHLIASTDKRTKAGDPVAKAADGWGITLRPDCTLRIPSPNERWCVIHANQEAAR